MNDNVDPSPRPRRILHDAQENAYRWHEICLKVHHGVSDIEPQVAERMYHTAVLNLWKQLDRFRDEKTAKELWNQPILQRPTESDPLLSELLDYLEESDVDPAEISVDEARDLVRPESSVGISLSNIAEHYHLQVDEQQPTVDNPRGDMVTRTLSVPDAFVVHRQLDDVAHNIGFDADLPDPVADMDEAVV